VFENNQGEEFEQVVIWSNMQYYERREAVIQKIAVPWNVQRKFDYVSNSNTIVTAYPMGKSTVDFGGTARGKSIWFDAKVTKSKTSFPLSNFKDHQHEYLERVMEQGGLAFYLVYCQPQNKTWLLWYKDFYKWRKENDRKSIPLKWLDENCVLVHPSKEIALDYLSEVFKHEQTDQGANY
jgi:recombination protein U